MGDPIPNCANHNTTLRNKFELERRHYVDRHSEVMKNLPNTKSSPSKHSQRQHAGSEAMETDEIVKHMSKLPSFLERGKPVQDKALTFGVMDWGRLEKWQYQHHKPGVVKSNKCSPSSSNSSSLFSTDGSSPQSSRGYSCSPARQKHHRVTLQSHLNIPPKEILTPYVKSCAENLDKLKDFHDASRNHCGEKNTTCKTKDPYAPNIPRSKLSLDKKSCQPTLSPSLKGKMKIQDESVNELQNMQDPSRGTRAQDHLERQKMVVLLPRDSPQRRQTVGKKSLHITHRSFSGAVGSVLNNNVPRSCPLQTEIVNNENSKMEPDSSRTQSSPPGDKMSTPSKNADLKMGNIAAGKQRSKSPLRRFSFSMSSKSAAPVSATKRAESPPVSRNSTQDNPCVSTRAHSSPLRRLLDPLFPSKASNSRQSADLCHQDSKMKPKAKLDFRAGTGVRANDESRTMEKGISSIKQALFQAVIKNGRPLFTFAVENDILAATVRSLSSSGKDDSNNWIYTFFTVHETKKKNGSWLLQGSKSKDHGYVPNITAQMKVSNPAVSHHNTMEFVLFSVDPTRFDYQTSDVKPQDELAAIVVEFSRKTNVANNPESFSTTVILPGGSHGVPSKGEPSPLTERWRSGGVCDCGGWDIGCRLRTLANQAQPSRSSSTKVHTSTGKFELFFQGEVPNERPFFSLSPLREGIFSVEYNSSLSLLQAFSICISVVECKKASEFSTNVPKRVQEDVPIRCAPFPPLSPVSRV